MSCLNQWSFMMSQQGYKARLILVKESNNFRSRVVVFECHRLLFDGCNIVCQFDTSHHLRVIISNSHYSLYSQASVLGGTSHSQRHRLCSHQSLLPGKIHLVPGRKSGFLNGLAWNQTVKNMQRFLCPVLSSALSLPPTSAEWTLHY